MTDKIKIEIQRSTAKALKELRMGDSVTYDTVIRNLIQYLTESIDGYDEDMMEDEQ